ncbi:unnamed protein product [Linum trigynum]|uniref:RING-type domain-containing protein n=1 Tax=Linum trigynum TaxID=586398 RepID=A0AAV2D4X4_9ROSI
MDEYYCHVPASIPIILEVLVILLPAVGLYLTLCWPQTSGPGVIVGEILKLEAAGGGARDDRCPICLQEFKGGDECVDLTVCRHFYHKRCIDAWLGKNCICPLCRASVCRRPASSSSTTAATPAAA